MQQWGVGMECWTVSSTNNHQVWSQKVSAKLSALQQQACNLSDASRHLCVTYKHIQVLALAAVAEFTGLRWARNTCEAGSLVVRSLFQWVFLCTPLFLWEQKASARGTPSWRRQQAMGTPLSVLLTTFYSPSSLCCHS